MTELISEMCLLIQKHFVISPSFREQLRLFDFAKAHNVYKKRSTCVYDVEIMVANYICVL
jgi:hypothetical protein